MLFNFEGMMLGNCMSVVMTHSYSFCSKSTNPAAGGPESDLLPLNQESWVYSAMANKQNENVWNLSLP